MSALSIRNMNQTLGEREQRQWAAEHKAYIMDVCQQIRDLLGQDEYNAWWETTSEAGFDKEAEIKLLQLKRDQNDFDDEYFRIDKQIEPLVDAHVHQPIKILSSTLRERPFADRHPLGVVGTAFTYCLNCRKILSLDNEAAKMAMLDDGLDDAIIGSLP